MRLPLLQLQSPRQRRQKRACCCIKISWVVPQAKAELQLVAVFPRLTNRGYSNQQDFEINNEVNVEDLWRLTFNRRVPAYTQPKYFAPNGGKVVNLSGLAENKVVNCMMKQMKYEK